MTENQPTIDLIERLARVDSKLEKLLAHQTLSQDEGLAETQPSPNEKFSKNILVADSEDEKIHPATGFSGGSKNPLPFRVAVSGREADSIFQKVDKINRDVEVILRVETIERQNRKIVILGSMFMTVSLLAFSAFGYLMIQGNFLNKEAFLHAGQKVDPPHSSSGEAIAKVNSPQLPAPIIAAHDPLPAEPVLKVADPQPVTTPPDPKPAEAAGPVKYVGYMASNKYHYPGCKWAAEISHYKHRTFSSVKEAREKGYIPCPTCHPPKSD
jgi:hypothetical protein